MNEEEAASEGTFLALASCSHSAVSEKQVLVCERGLCRLAKSQDTLELWAGLVSELLN